MAHLNTEPGDHDHTVSFFIIRTDFDEPRLLLHRHKRIGKLMMFGGHVELDEDPWSATLREITEETGYEHEQLAILQPTAVRFTLAGALVHPVAVCQSTAPYPGETLHFHSDTAYALTADSAPRGLPGSGESTEFRLLNADGLAVLRSSEVVPMWQNLGLEILANIYPRWVPVPLRRFAPNP